MAVVLSRRSAPTIAPGVPIEVKNQARVHLWYEAHFGYPYPKLASAKEGIDRLLIPSTCVGVRRLGSSQELYVPNGLSILTPAC